MTSRPCPACDATTARPLFWKAAGDETARPGVKPPEIAGYQLVACTQCGLGRVEPLPTSAELAALYGDAYFDVAAFQGRASDPLLTYRRVGGPPRLAAIRAASMRAYERRHVAALGQQYRALHAGREPRRLLDVGAGGGAVLAAACEAGWTAVGVEPSALAARAAAEKGLVVLPTPLDEAGFPDGSFDIVHIREVLEHVVDPLAVLREARRVLRPDGVLYVQVPNDLEGYRAGVFRRVWWLIPPFHLWYFTFSSLTRLLERAGLVARQRGTLGMGAGVDTYRYLGARVGALGWLDAHEDDPRLALVPRLARAGFRAAGTPADAALNRAQRHSSLWLYSTPSGASKQPV